MNRKIVTGYPSTMGDDVQLNMTTLIRHAARTYGDQQIVFRTQDGGWDRYTYGECYQRVCRAANVLRGLGVEPGDRVGVLDWNNRRHFELYWAISGIAAVGLQMNPRLGPDDLEFVVQHSDATFIAVDETLLPIAEAIASQTDRIKGWIVMTDRPLSAIKSTLSPLYHYEDLLTDSDASVDWPEIDERSACSACYTTGTTGRPKGIYYSHRAIYLHSVAIALAVGMTIDDCTMPVTPMFHGQSWGLPQAATLMANKIVLPGRYLAEETAPLTEAIIREGVTIANGAPAILQPMLEHIRARGERPDLSRTRLLSGATEPPLSLMRGFHDETGAEVIHMYGSTETTPLVTMNRLKPTLKDTLTADERWNLKRKQGLPATGIDIAIRNPKGVDLPHDGLSVGEICVRGPWITAKYHGMPDSGDRFTDDGFWRSGDAGTIDQFGYVKLTDRIKDVIKSGGEWISSIDMENAIMAHPSVLEAAVFGVPHPKWHERPLALVVVRSGHELSADVVRKHLASQFAKWQLPEQVIFTNAIARTSVGKIDKKLLRVDYQHAYHESDDR
jgi:acyl-CoA synthetase (AMP-forming)/AMP-acid ligase II